MCKANIKNKGISIIEMVIAIVVVGLAIPPLARNWFDVTTRSIRSERSADAAFYGQELMEEIRTKRFDEEINPPWTTAAQFGAKRPDENDETTRAKFDDVDDFAGYNDTLNGYRRWVAVNYANITASTWQSAAAETDFKRVAVSVTRNGTAATNITLTTVFERY
ncbi:MAG: hypothetical protein MUC52_03055 [Candidatus Omnitrophica bacterium]|jgi:type II secretory pathway pseudopilin PulG|nr:hypothetical protein [Candidatus Omnitrophota bacterium]